MSKPKRPYFFKIIALIDDTNDQILDHVPVFWHSVREHIPDGRFHLTCDHLDDSHLLDNVLSNWKKPVKSLKRFVLPTRGNAVLYQKCPEDLRLCILVLSSHSQEDWGLWPGFLDQVKDLQRQSQTEIHLERARNMTNHQDLHEAICGLTFNGVTSVVILQRSQYPKFNQGAYVRVGETHSKKCTPLLLANRNLERKDYL